MLALFLLIFTRLDGRRGQQGAAAFFGAAPTRVFSLELFGHGGIDHQTIVIAQFFARQNIAACGNKDTPITLVRLATKASVSPLTAPQALALIAQPLLDAVLVFKSKGFAPLQSAFQKRDVLRDMPVTLSDGRQGIARGVDNTGVLRVETPQGMQLINSAEVRVRPSIEESL